MGLLCGQSYYRNTKLYGRPQHDIEVDICTAANGSKGSPGVLRDNP